MHLHDHTHAINIANQMIIVGPGNEASQGPPKGWPVSVIVVKLDQQDTCQIIGELGTATATPLWPDGNQCMNIIITNLRSL
jgi:hypothetical protein